MGRTAAVRRNGARRFRLSRKALGGSKVRTALGASRAGAREIRALLPRIWRQFRSASSTSSAATAAASASVGVQVASLPVKGLRLWLQGLRGPVSRLGFAQVGALRDVLRDVERLKRLRQRLGFRFKDPSQDGSWGVENIVGHVERAAGPGPKKRHAKVSWDISAASFQLRLLERDVVEVRRCMDKEVVCTRVEKRRHGEPGGPLAEELIAVTACGRRKEAWDRRKKIRVVRRTCDLLPAVILRPPSGPQRWTLIYLHGLGSSALGNYADRPHYFVDGSVAIKVVIPTAPSRELTCFDSWWLKNRRTPDTPSGAPRYRLQKFLSWYDYVSNHDGRREDTIDWNSLGAMQRALHHLIRSEASELGGRTDHIILGGKSQGCCTALDAALTFPQPLGGFIGLVGHLLSCTPVERGGPQAAVPFHFFHEVEDRIMQWAWVQKGEQKLRDAGYSVHSRHCRDPEGHGHFIEGVEGQWIRSALRTLCGPRGVAG
mmetsp:Transcript_21000/g.44724  ORF Transcript_21000/g.44724 Transcript_21000/m.44724 type:complete len:488 (-) Transcript_21000:22-1485(-)